VNRQNVSTVCLVAHTFCRENLYTTQRRRSTHLLSGRFFGSGPLPFRASEEKEGDGFRVSDAGVLPATELRGRGAEVSTMTKLRV
jgi:hypothetical protein